MSVTDGADAPLIEMSGITKRFPGVLALDDIKLDFRAGEVHALVGENGAGKSTLINVLAGTQMPDSGTLRIGGRTVRISSPLVSHHLGIRVVFQELALCENLTIAENVMMPSVSGERGLAFKSRGRMRRGTRKALDWLGIPELDPDRQVGGLFVAQMQLVEIARAISQHARVVVLDEPNSALSHRESEKLFEVVHKLRHDGVTVLYISHHLQEVLTLADRITVMRDGRVIETLDNVDVSEERLIVSMVGRNISYTARWSLQPEAQLDDRETVLSVRDLSDGRDVRRVNFDIRAGEILGIGGMPDSGKDDLAETLFGLRRRSGEIIVDGAPVAGKPAHHVAAGMALIPADRREGGALMTMSVASNIVSASLARFSFAGFLRRGRIRREARGRVAQLDARVSSLTQRIATLSGGNQQKIILSRGLVTNPRVLIMHEPTRGVDVGAKAEIYDILKSIAREEGVAILIISSELPELILHTARVLVMRDGRIAGELTEDAITEEAILALALTL